MKRHFYRMFDYALYGFQRFALYFFQGFTSAAAAMVLTTGVYLVTAAWLVQFFGEERTIAFIEHHPYMFAITVVLFTACTGGLAYWAYSRDADDLHANLRRRLAKHGQLFEVA